MIDEIEKAKQEDRSVLLDIYFDTGIVTYRSHDINMKEIEVLIKDINKDRVLILSDRSATNTSLTVYVDITDSRTFYMDHSGEDGSIRNISTDLKLCKIYNLYTREKNINGYHSCMISITINEKEN